MKRRLRLLLTCMLVFGLGCDGPSEETIESSPVPPLHDPNSPLAQAIERHREELKNVPGRTGILAEPRRYSLFDEELIIRDFFQDRRGGFYLDIGCAWPTMANNTVYLEKHLDWTGIGVDALPDFADAWAAERPKSKFFNHLVTDRSGAKETFYKSPDIGISSADKEWASGKPFGQTLETEEIEVTSITLDDLLAREGVTKIDLLAMDIEGHELTALKGFDLNRYRPELIVVEASNPEVFEYLNARGYQVIEKYIPFDSVNRYFAPKPGPPS